MIFSFNLDTERRSSTITCSSDVTVPVQSNIGDFQVNNFQHLDDVTTPVTTSVKVEIIEKENVAPTAEQAEIVALIEGYPIHTTQTYKDDYVEMYWDRFPKPLVMTEQNIVKRDVDDIPFDNTVGLCGFNRILSNF